MRIGLIGCGRAGVTIFHLLRRNNKVTGVYDKRKKNERIAAQLFKINRNPALKDLVSKSQAIFIATPDDEILNAYRKIQKYINTKKYIFHLSGILPADIIPRSQNISRASVHPFATFPIIAVPSRTRHFLLSVEGDAAAIEGARMIFHKDNFTLRKIRKKDKVIYHLIGVFSSNLLVGLVSSIQRLANMIDWHHEQFEEMIFPIIEETVNNLKKYGAKRSLSGPIARGDLAIIKKHLRALKSDPSLLNVYKALSRTIAEDIAGAKRQQELKKILK